MYKEGDVIILNGVKYKVIRKINKPMSLSMLEDEESNRMTIPNPNIYEMLKEKNMILSIDASISSSGYCIGDKQGNIITYGKIPTDKKDFENEDIRINFIGDKIDKLIKEYKIKEVIIEDQFTSVNAKTILLLRKLIGVISRVAYQHKLTISYYYPTTWRKALGINKGKANDKKLAAHEYITSKGIDIEFKISGKNKTDDIIDSIAIYFAYIKEG